MASNSPQRGLKSKIFKGQFTEDLEQIYDAEGSPFLGTRRGMARPVFLRFPRLERVTDYPLRRRNEVWKRKNPFSANPQFWVFGLSSCNERKTPLVTERKIALCCIARGVGLSYTLFTSIQVERKTPFNQQLLGRNRIAPNTVANHDDIFSASQDVGF